MRTLIQVHPHVGQQILPPTKAFCTGVTGLRPPLCGAGPLSALVTGRAGVLAGVNPHVLLQVVTLAKGFLAEAAGVGPLPRVRPGVAQQAVPLAEPLSTGVTGKGLLARVDPAMDQQAALLVEALSTGVTGKGPLTCVDPHVCCQRAVLGETLPTFLAPVRLPGRSSTRGSLVGVVADTCVRRTGV